jgi:hypothetical protein
MQTRLLQAVQPELEYYTKRMEEILPGFISAFYLHGSLALDAFNPRFSDIDFIAILSRKPAEQDIACLRQVHREIGKKFPGWEWDGCYLQWRDLGRLREGGDPFPAFFDGRLRLTRQHGLNLVTWWVLKQRGVTLVGPSAQELDFELDWSMLISEMHGNLNTYWANWTCSPVQIAKLLSDWGIQ